jgi:hypothetical protein
VPATLPRWPALLLPQPRTPPARRRSSCSVRSPPPPPPARGGVAAKGIVGTKAASPASPASPVVSLPSDLDADSNSAINTLASHPWSTATLFSSSRHTSKMACTANSPRTSSKVPCSTSAVSRNEPLRCAAAAAYALASSASSASASALIMLLPYHYTPCPQPTYRLLPPTRLPAPKTRILAQPRPPYRTRHASPYFRCMTTQHTVCKQRTPLTLSHLPRSWRPPSPHLPSGHTGTVAVPNTPLALTRPVGSKLWHVDPACPAVGPALTTCEH